MARKKKQSIKVDTLIHEKESRKNIPTAEFQTVIQKDERIPLQAAYERTNRDLDPQLVWRGKDPRDWSDLVVQAPPLYIQEKVHPKVLVDDLMRESKERATEEQYQTLDLFDDFNGLPDNATATEFYQHDANWTNRMILGDSLQVMASLAEREGLRGKVQCIYVDPPYGINFNSNFQWSTTDRNPKDEKAEHITREPEQVRAFRDTWQYGIHSYLTYLRDRLTVSRDLLSDSGSIFVQIGDENVHLIRVLLDEIFGSENFVSMISYATTGGFNTSTLSRAGDYLIWYAKNSSLIKYRQLFTSKVSPLGDSGNRNDQVELNNLLRRALSKEEKLGKSALPNDARIFRYDNLLSQGAASIDQQFEVNGKIYTPAKNCHWKANYPNGMSTLLKARRITKSGNRLVYVRFFDDFSVQPIHNIWTNIGGSVQSRVDPKLYVVQTGTPLIERCILMCTDPGDLVIDPTCGAGTAALAAEKWGRRWITIDTSRVALTLARTRIMGARYPYYLLADSKKGQKKEAEISQAMPSEVQTQGNIRQGFVYERVPHITLKSIANNMEINIIWENFQDTLELLRGKLNEALDIKWEEWEIPREAEEGWSKKVKELHAHWWEKCIQRQKEIDNSIATKADFEYLYDKPYVDSSRTRVAGPFTVESLSPHRVLTVDQDDELINTTGVAEGGTTKTENNNSESDFAQMMLENLKTSGIQQAHKEDKINFTSLIGWPGHYLCAESRFMEGDIERRGGVFIGPEFGTVSRPDLVAAAREAADAGFDVLIACAFNYDAHASDFNKLGSIPVLRATMNADLHMADDLKNTGKGNLFVIFGEPDIEIQDADDNKIKVKINGVDVFHPQTGEIESSGPDGIACWFIDTDYNEESFFVRHAYFLGANDPYKALKTTLKSEIDKEAWESLHSDTSRPFEKPSTGRIAVKVINHLGDEVMKVFGVS
jgi:adenine-specific DNA-methyltransferase